jgi:hypothetical protein
MVTHCLDATAVASSEAVCRIPAGRSVEFVTQSILANNAWVYRNGSEDVREVIVFRKILEDVLYLSCLNQINTNKAFGKSVINLIITNRICFALRNFSRATG